MRPNSKKLIAALVALTQAITPIAASAQATLYKVPVRGLIVESSSNSNGNDQTGGGGGTTPTSGADIVLSTENLTFPATEVGASVTLSVVATNMGTEGATLNIQTGSTEYSVTHNCGLTLAPQASCTLNVSFIPSAGTNFKGRVTVAPLGGVSKYVNLLGSGLGAALQFSATVLDFGSVGVNTDAARSVTVTNNGTREATLGAPVSTAGYVVDSTTCGSTLAVAASCSYTIRFTPKVVGTANGTLTATANTGTGNTSAMLTLTGVGRSAQLNVDVTALDFGAVAPNATKTLSMVVSNSGNASTPVQLTGLSAPFSITGCSTPLDSKKSCTATVTYAPTEVGSAAQMLSVVGSADIINIPTTGRGVVPGTGDNDALNLKLEPSALSLGTAYLNEQATPKSVLLTNAGSEPVSINEVLTDSPFIASNPCGSTLFAGASCEIPVSIKSSDLGLTTSTLRVRTSAGIKSTALSATVLGAVLEASSTTVNFGTVEPGKSLTRLVTLTNVGNKDANLAGSQPSAPFSFGSGSTCSATLAVGTSCTVAYTYTPTGQVDAEQNVTVSSGNMTLTLKLKGRGYLGQIDTSSKQLELGAVPVGATTDVQSVEVLNTGVTPVTFNSVSVDGDYSATTSCGSTLAPGTSCTVSVTLKPTAVGPRTGAITLDTQAGISIVSLSGTGLGALTAMTGMVDFELVPMGSSATLQVNITNSGNITLTDLAVANDGPFLVVNNCPTTLAAKASCSLTITARPTSLGISQGTLTVTSNSVNSPAKAVLSVDGSGSRASMDPTLAFGAIDYLSTGNDREVTVTNTGSIPMTITEILGLDSSQFRVRSNTCQNIAVGATCTLKFGMVTGLRGTYYARAYTRGADINASILLSGQVLGAEAYWETTNVNFGGKYTGTSTQRTVRLVNLGNRTADFSTLTGQTAGITADASACAAVAADRSCDVVFTFAPTVKGAYSATGVRPSGPVWIGAYNTLSLSGTGLEETAETSVTNLSFGGVVMGQTSAAKAVSLLSTGNTALTISSVTTTGPFEAVTTCSTSLEPGSSCATDVVFKPTSAGELTGSLVFQTSAGKKTVALYGSGMAPLTASFSNNAYAVGALSGDVGRVVLNQTGTYDIFIVSDSDAALLSVGAQLPAGSDFTFVKAERAYGYKNNLGQTLYEAVSCDATVTATSVNNCTAAVSGSRRYDAIHLVVQFKPTGAAGTKTATLSVTHNGSNTSPLTMTLQGLGALDAQASFSTKTLTFDPTLIGNNQALAVRLTNSGTATLTFSQAPSITGNAAFTFPAGGSTTCGASLAPGAYCDTQVVFTPTSQGEVTGSLVFQSDSLSSPDVVALTGIGQRGWGALTAANGSSTNFGSVMVSTTQDEAFVFSNAGNLPVTGTYAAISGAGLSMVSNTCGTSAAKASVAAGGTCTVTVRWTPTAAGTLTGSLSVTSTALNSPSTVNFSGTATGLAQLDIAPNPVSMTPFVSVQGTQDVVFTNSGTGPLSITSTPFLVSGAKLTMTTNCGATLAVGASCKATLKFTSTNTLTFTDTLRMVSELGTHSVPVTATAQQAVVTLAPDTGSSVDFGKLSIGGSSSNTYVLSNTGNASVTGMTVALTGSTDVSITSNDCTSTLASGAQCRVTVRYSPTTADGLANVQLSVSSTMTAGITLPTPLQLTGTTSVTNIVQVGATRFYSDNTYAASCYGYKTGSTDHPYAGATGDGVYRIQPPGQSALDVYCDMTNDGGGWTLVLMRMKGQVTAYSTTNAYNMGTSPAPFTNSTPANSAAKHSDAFINAIPHYGTARFRMTLSYNGTKYTRFIANRTYDHMANSAAAKVTSYNNEALTTGARAGANQWGYLCGMTDYSYSGANYAFFQTNGAGSGTCSTSNGGLTNVGNGAANGWPGVATDFLNMWVR